MAKGTFSASNYYSGAAPVTAVPLTMACWGYLNSSGGAYGVMYQGISGSGTNRFSLYISGGLDVSVATDDAGGQSIASRAGPSTGTWFHMGGVWSAANNRRAYFNGVGGTAQTTSRTPAGVSQMRIGLSMTSTAGFPGYLAECGTWNAALTDAEMAALAKGVSPLLIRPANLVSFAPLMDGGPVDWTETPLAMNGTVPNTDLTPRIIRPSYGQY